MEKHLQRIKEVEHGRFLPLFKACSGFCPSCFNCRSFDGEKRENYRCYVIGSCPAASLKREIIERIIAK